MCPKILFPKHDFSENSFVDLEQSDDYNWEKGISVE